MKQAISHWLSNIWLVFNSVVYLVLGYLFIFEFQMITSNLGIVPQSGSAAIELMTVYGGLELGLGLLFLIALFVQKYRLFAQQLLVFSYLSFFLGRFAGILSFDEASPITFYLFAFELIGFAISLLLLKMSGHKTDR